MEEDVTEAIPQIVAPSQPASEEKAGEFVLREILGATPLKERDK